MGDLEDFIKTFLPNYDKKIETGGTCPRCIERSVLVIDGKPMEFCSYCQSEIDTEQDNQKIYAVEKTWEIEKTKADEERIAEARDRADRILGERDFD